MHWNPIINSGNPQWDRADNVKDIARYTLTNKFMTDFLESTPTGVKLAEKVATLDV